MLQNIDLVLIFNFDCWFHFLKVISKISSVENWFSIRKISIFNWQYYVSARTHKMFMFLAIWLIFFNTWSWYPKTFPYFLRTRIRFCNSFKLDKDFSRPTSAHSRPYRSLLNLFKDFVRPLFTKPSLIKTLRLSQVSSKFCNIFIQDSLTVSYSCMSRKLLLT